MATNRNPNPHATTNLTNWSKNQTTGSTTLTSTSEGARWVGSATGTGRYIQIKVPYSSLIPYNYFCVSNMLVRRNSGTAQISRIFLDGDYQYDAGGYGGITGTTANDTRYGSYYLPTGQFVVFPASTSAMCGSDALDPYPSAPARNKDSYFDILIFASDNAAFDFTIRNVLVYKDDDLPTQPAPDTSDATFTITQAANSKTITGVWNKLPDEAISTLKWEWGDGTAAESGGSTSAAYQTRSHTYANPGIYTVKLTSSFTAGSVVSAFTTKSVTVPVGTFEAHYNYETDFLNVNVDASSSIAPSVSPIDTYAWDWGDGTTTAASASKLASHSYAAPGTYNITLTVNDTATARTDTEVKAVLITAPPNPDNYFVANRNLLTVGFVPSIQDGSSYSWSFGDGDVSTAKEPTHVFPAPGTYSVSLTVNGSLTTTQDVTVSDVYTSIGGNLMDKLSLEVAIPYGAGVIYNRLKNPSGELGSWGWSTPLTNSYVTASTEAITTADKGIPGAKLIYRSSGSGTQVIYSAPAAVTAGQYVSAQMQSPYVDGYYRVTVQALSAAGAVLGSSATSGYQTASATATVRTTPYVLPAGTTHARVMLNHYSNTSAGTPAVGKLFQFRRVMLATAATSAELTSNPYLEFADWQDLIGPTSEISVNRSALNVGTLSANILDSTFDPATNGTIRPGQQCRLRVKTQDSQGNVQYQSIFTGTVTDAPTEYVPYKGTGDVPVKYTKINLTATDAITTLSQIKEPRGVAKIEELPELLESTGVPFEVNGSTDQVPTASIVNANENASILDQVAITRDTDAGYAFIDRNNVLKVVEPAYMPTAPVGIVDETVFADVKASFNMSDLINEVYINWQRYIPAAGAEPASVEEVTYGPYRDEASIAEWGLRTATFTMIGVENATTIANKANAILAANAQPARMINSVTIPIRHVEDLAPGKALIDLYDLVRLGYQRTETDELSRVTKISHSIRATKKGGDWRTIVGFSADGTVASPQFVQPPPVTFTSSALPHGQASGLSGSATQSLANVTAAKVTTAVLTSVTTQGAVTWDATNNRYVVSKAGIYNIHARVAWSGNATGTRLIYIYKNGSLAFNIANPPPSATAFGQALTVPLSLAVGDYVELWAYQSSGAALNLINNAGNCGFVVTFLGA